MQNKNFQSINWDKNFTERYVICNQCALARNALVIEDGTRLNLFTKFKKLNFITTQAFAYYYNPDIDYEYEVTPSKTNPLLLLPSKERAIVECIKWLDYVDEGVLIEALQSYLDYFWSDRIYEVGNHFGVNKETLDYWFKEAREDEEV